jgi:hypothetical protein
MVATFDTLRAARRLKEAGASEPIAEAIAEALRESRELDLAQLATKADLAALDSDLRREIATLRGEIATLRGELLAKIEGVKVDILKWVIGLMIAQAALIVTLVRLTGHP